MNIYLLYLGGGGAKETITIYKTGELWYFHHYFLKGDVYRKLAHYYNPHKRQFELHTIEDFNKVVEYLKYNNFEIFLSHGLQNQTKNTLTVIKLSEQNSSTWELV